MDFRNADNPSPRPTWRKVAYGGLQPRYDDNHADESFLEGMVMNASVVKRDMLKVMLDSVSLSKYPCIVALVVLVWTYTLRSTLDVNSLLFLDASLLVSGFLVLIFTLEMLSLNLLLHYFLNIAFFTTGLYVLAPIYQTLTRSISSDSIWAVTVPLLLLHLFLHDYSESTVKTPWGSEESSLDQLYLCERFCSGLCFYCFSSSIKATCVCHHAFLIASFPFRSTGYLLL